MNKVPRWVFCYVSNKTFDFSSKKIGFFAQNDPIRPQIGIFVYCWLIWCPVGGLVGGCGAGCISQDTYLPYHYEEDMKNQLWLVKHYNWALRVGENVMKNHFNDT